MNGTYEWADAFDEIHGRTPGLAPSPWDGLSIMSRVVGMDAPFISPGDVDMSTTLGGREGAKKVDLPIVLTDESGGLLSPHARLALIQAAARTGCALRLRDPAADYLELAQELGVTLWVVLGPHRSASVVRAMRGAAVVELLLVDVAPDGGTTVPLDAWDKDGSLTTAVGTLDSVFEAAQVYVNVGAASDRATLRAAMASGADGVVVQARSRASHLGRIVAGPGPLAAVAGLRRQSNLAVGSADATAPRRAVSGGFKDGTEVAKALALGADLVMLATAPRIAIGCTLCDECGPGECPTGADSDGGADRADWKAEGQRLVDYIGRVATQARVALAQMGCMDAASARPDHLEANSYDVAAITGVALSGYGEELPMWRH
jgi:hypothetical protein